MLVTSIIATSSSTVIKPVPEPVTSMKPAGASPVVNKSPTCGVGNGLGSSDVLLYGYLNVIAVPAA